MFGLSNRRVSKSLPAIALVPSAATHDPQIVLDVMPANIMLCSLPDFEITYMNEACKATLRRIEHELPIAVDDMLGHSIDVFHKNPAHQRAILNDPKNLPHVARIALGEEFLRLEITALFGADGRYVGPMLTWQLITDQVHAEREAAKLMAMLDQMPINVMACDKETWEINYLNQTSVETLREIENHLPIRADDMFGSSIDVFHKHPEHQQKMLADPSNLPHRARIKVGPETLDLNVSAIYDQDGGYIGPMVNWTRRTQLEKLSNDFREIIANAVGSVAGSAAEMETSAAALSGGAGDLNGRMQVVSAAAEEVTATVQAVAGSTEEMSTSINEIAEQVNRSSTMAADAVTSAEQTSEVVGSLREASSRIGDVVAIINDIAEQTNLLALNATIEAARAGDAGKGFAVVASEVKSLANQTAKSTNEISEQVKAIQAATGDAVTAIDTISNLIGELNHISGGIAASVEQQNAATREISRNIQETAMGTSKVSQNVSSMLTVVNQILEQANGFTDKATQLATTAKGLDTNAKGFVSVVDEL